MLDTGIDVPEVVNLVFFKVVRSKTKFWQMIGRGTRLCPDLFGPGLHKEFFQVFDWCRNFEFFNQNPDLVEGASGESLAKRLFVSRVDLIGELDALADKDESAPAGAFAQGRTPVLQAGEQGSVVDDEARRLELREALASRLREEVEGMSLDNFIVRPRRRLVEKYAKGEAWAKLGLDERHELADGVAGLPSSLVDDDIAAKQFDLLVLRTQLAMLRAEKSFDGLRKKIVQIGGLLEELANVPMVAKELQLILDVQSDEFWQDITLPMLETVRRRLRDLVKLIELRRRPIVYTDFEDEIGPGVSVDIGGVSVGTDMDRFRLKARHFLKDHQNHIAVLKLRRNEPLTATDLAELERIFVAAGAGPTDLERIAADGGLGLYVRSLVGMDREAAKRAFDAFLAGKTPTSDQIEFLNMIIDHLTERGAMEPRLLYESPFTDLDPMGVEGVFGKAEVAQVIAILEDVRSRAAA
jgi:type I restriction enzyme R subunit